MRLSNDFARIENWTIAQHNREFTKDLAWLKSRLSTISKLNPTARIVVVTHFSPAFDNTSHPRHRRGIQRAENLPPDHLRAIRQRLRGSDSLKEKEWRSGSECFSSDALRIIHDSNLHGQITHWIFGHTHWNARLRSAGITLVSNQRCHEGDEMNTWQKLRLYRPFNPRATLSFEPRRSIATIRNAVLPERLLV